MDFTRDRNFKNARFRNLSEVGFTQAIEFLCYLFFGCHH